jgi:predicted secreted Zn-dependent protease
MRPIAVALAVAMLLAAAGVAAQDAQAPTPPEVNWLCDNAFVQAELHLAIAGADPDDPTAASTAGVAADAASGEPAIEPPRDAGYLDGAIRACASVDDFLAGAARHPALLESVEPIAWLQDRCLQPELAEYSTCVSLIHMLATPAPTATPAATASPRPRARPTAEPTQTGRAGRRGGDRSSTRPVPTRPRDGLVPVPAIKARVPGADRVRYFDIRGRTWAQLNTSTARKTRKLCENHRARACLSTRVSNVRPTYRIDRATGRCTLTGAKLSLRTVAYMPRWKAPERVSPSLAWVWRKSIARTGWHEAQHAKIAERYVRKLPGMVRGKPCSRFGAVAKRWFRQMGRAQARFDRRDYVKSAQVHARWFAQAASRFGR